ncbi:hypothetical protein [Nocardia salmonicida]|uniref:hypothetical protein n=1 Tax=Nocardia salmonicida TaxID=53431 RepID=UPI0033DF2178
MADHDPCAATGVDIGTARTKLALGPTHHIWDGPTPDDLWRDGHVDVKSLRTVLATAATANAMNPPRSGLGIAVPDHWMIRGHDDPLSTAASTPRGKDLIAALGTEFGQVHPVARSACLAAGLTDATDGVGLLCDVGAGTVDAAAFIRDGDTVRIFDVESAQVGTEEPTSLMLPSPSRAQVAALHDERVARSWRATRVLARAERFSAYQDTPVYLAGRHGGHIDARTVATALGPIGQLAATVVGRLLARIEVAEAVPLSVAGGNALGPVIAALRSVFATAVGSIAAGSVATGAARIAAGSVRVIGGYPYVIGVLSHHVHRGLLEPTVLAAPLSERIPLEIECVEPQSMSSIIRVRPEATGPWIRPDFDETKAVPPGHYQVYVQTRRASFGVLLLREKGSGNVLTFLVDPTRRWGKR